ncbi:uncharacterized protein BJ171DRAFT_619719 [Polychytrium aggregatum]|uniref:uncharacterized protein n=1 Tax=Polychytrium aggregatum TaxID=110093 RepID=UPI0022FDB79B|nr:uncharacterized protein BJ171DRAFT_619719 [Polychytrium aggregatum]KAI9204475.1 hypothetical protein BJ171DRAFT_619719 [Polychytrium aggregatum]
MGEFARSRSGSLEHEVEVIKYRALDGLFVQYLSEAPGSLERLDCSALSGKQSASQHPVVGLSIGDGALPIEPCQPCGITNTVRHSEASSSPPKSEHLIPVSVSGSTYIDSISEKHEHMPPHGRRVNRILPSKLDAVNQQDSGVDLTEHGQLPSESRINTSEAMKDIPRFYFPFGKPKDPAVFAREQEELMKTMRVIFQVTESSPSGTGLSLLEFFAVTEACVLPKFVNTALFKKTLMSDPASCPMPLEESTVSFTQFERIWTELSTKFVDECALVFAIMTQPGQTHLMPSDFEVVIKDVICNHFALAFLSTMSIFQTRYSGIFYEKPNYWNEKMTLPEFRKIGFTDLLRSLEREEDVNTTRDVFSYKHFYVIYCKFWELDTDHNMLIDLSNLVKYDSYSMTASVLKRVLDTRRLRPQGSWFMESPEAGEHPSLSAKHRLSGSCDSVYSSILQRGDSCSVMTYKEFVQFILACEDKQRTQSIEYWFRCLDTDSDGVISFYELKHFWDEQYERMISCKMSDPWKFTDFICSMIDLIKPKNDNFFTLSDLKRSKNPALFFDMLFDISKYDNYVRRLDPAFREMDEIWIIDHTGNKIQLEGWDKFVERSYSELAKDELDNTLGGCQSYATSGYFGPQSLFSFSDGLCNLDFDDRPDEWTLEHPYDDDAYHPVHDDASDNDTDENGEDDGSAAQAQMPGDSNTTKNVGHSKMQRGDDRDVGTSELSSKRSLRIGDKFSRHFSRIKFTSSAGGEIEDDCDDDEDEDDDEDDDDNDGDSCGGDGDGDGDGKLVGGSDQSAGGPLLVPLATVKAPAKVDGEQIVPGPVCGNLAASNSTQTAVDCAN